MTKKQMKYVVSMPGSCQALQYRELYDKGPWIVSKKILQKERNFPGLKDNIIVLLVLKHLQYVMHIFQFNKIYKMIEMYHAYECVRLIYLAITLV